jgi:hypothetical protein
MSVIRRYALACGLLLLASAPAAPPVLAHAPDPLATAVKAPAPNAALESASGTVHELVVEDKVAGVTLRYLSLRTPNGDATALAGPGADKLQHGAVAEVIGRRNGQVMFVESAHATAAKSAKRASDAIVEGELRIAHADDFPTGTSRYLYEVRQADGAIARLVLPTRPEALQAGMRVTVHGTRDVEDRVDPARIEILALAPDVQADATAPAVTAKATATHSVLVVLMNFSNTTSDPLPVASVQNVMVNNTNSVANFFREVSYGQHALNVTVTRAWLRSTMAAPTTCNYTSIGSAADAAATAAGYTPTNYEYRVYVFPRVSACGWSGLAYIGSPKKAWINGAGAVGTNVIAHEMGHNFGLLHAASLDCAARVTGGACASSEYGDPFNVMGNQRAMHYDAKQKALLGWIPAATVATHTGGNATYVLNPLETAGGSLYAVKIPAATNRTYWLEYRQPVGFDAPLASYPNTGAQLRLASPFETMCSGCGSYSIDTQFLDTTPGTTAFTDGTLLAGRSYTDTDYGFTVNVISATASALTVQVSGPGGGAAATSTVLASSANPSAAGASVTFTATVSGNAPGGTVAFTANGANISGCGASALAGTGNVRTATCSTAALATGVHSIAARYSGNATNLASSSAVLSQSVNALTSGTTNVALASAGAVASASSVYSSNYPIASVNNNERKGADSGGRRWKDATPNAWPDWVQIALPASRTISKVVVYSVQDNYISPVEPTDTLTFTRYGLTAFQVQAWNGSTWVSLASVSGNKLVKRTVTFTPYTTTRLRVLMTGSSDGYARTTEIEAWGN